MLFVTSEAEETAQAWLDSTASDHGLRGMTVATVRRKGYPSIHIGRGRIVGPGALEWFRTLQRADAEALDEILVAATRLPDIQSDRLT
jgi:hypothetical protein